MSQSKHEGKWKSSLTSLKIEGSNFETLLSHYSDGQRKKKADQWNRLPIDDLLPMKISILNW